MSGLTGILRAVLVGGVQFVLGGLFGFMLDLLYPKADADKSMVLEAVEVVGQAGLSAMVYASSVSFIIDRLDPFQQAGPIFAFALLFSQRSLNVRIVRLVSRLKVALLELLDPGVGAGVRADAAGSGQGDR